MIVYQPIINIVQPVPRNLVDAQYRAACMLNESQKMIAELLKSRVRLRKSMAICLHNANQSLDAQMCAFATERLIIDNIKSHLQQEDQIFFAQDLKEMCVF